MNKPNLFRMAVLAALMASRVALEAGTPFPVAGTYSGLFLPTSGLGGAWGPASQSSAAGLIKITTTAQGAYSANVQVEKSHYSHSGALTAGGEAAFEAALPYGNWLQVAFQVSPADPDVITGTISNSTWAANFSADRAVFDGHINVCPNAGKYTFVIEGDPSSTNSPGGDSYGTVTVNSSGHVSFSGFLADGHSVSQSATVSKAGLWPLFLPVYGGHGVLYSWLAIDDSTNGAVSGTVTWEKPALSSEWYYPAGFSIQAPVLGSHYAHPLHDTPVLNFANGWLSFTGGQLDQPITNSVILTINNHLENLGSGWLNFSFSLGSGTFHGRYRDYNTWTDFDIYGVVLQDYNVGAGCFPGWDQSGQVWLQSQ